MSLRLENIVKNSRIAFESNIDSIKKDRVLNKFTNLILRNKKKFLKKIIRI